MEKTHERETHDFMNVESFSQLPFIRPTPVNKEKASGIKLFGIEFGAAGPTDEPTNCATVEASSASSTEETKDSESGGDNGRRFECHYCCRNFPTSQALGGHQNAHKRERQHAKRAHLQSAMAHGGLSDAHVYGFMNYGRLSSAAATTMTYPSWNNSGGTINSTSSHARFYGSHGSFSHQQPINGSPLTLWRIPATAQSNHSAFNRDSHSLHPLPLVIRDEMKQSQQGGNNNHSANSQSRYEGKGSMQDHVSLDLHL